MANGSVLFIAKGHPRMNDGCYLNNAGDLTRAYASLLRTSATGTRAPKRAGTEVSPAMTMIVPSTAAMSNKADGWLEVPPLLAKWSTA